MIRRLFKKIFKTTPAHQPKPITLTVHQDDETHVINTLSGTSILQLLKKHQLDVPHYCGGCCRCGTCVVEIKNRDPSLSKMSGNEGMVLGLEKSQKGHRLACQAIVYDHLEILIPEWF